MPAKMLLATSATWVHLSRRRARDYSSFAGGGSFFAGIAELLNWRFAATVALFWGWLLAVVLLPQEQRRRCSCRFLSQRSFRGAIPHQHRCAVLTPPEGEYSGYTAKLVLTPPEGEYLTPRRVRGTGEIEVGL